MITAMHHHPEHQPQGLRDRIQRRRAFESVREEAYLSLLLTTSLLDSAVSALLKEKGLSQPAYNALRILAGDDESLTCSEIRERMVARVPDVTRLVDRLVERGLVSRERSQRDRRVVRVAITPAGRDAIAGLETRLIEHHDRSLASLSDDEAGQLTALLNRVRASLETAPPTPTHKEQS